jgi:hypothetical protein
MLQASLDAAIASHNTYGMAIAHGQLGIASVVCENWRVSFDHFTEAIKLSQRIFDKRLEFVWKGYMGLAHLTLTDYGRAYELLLVAEKVSR